jgi:hypothetical protein
VSATRIGVPVTVGGSARRAAEIADLGPRVDDHERRQSSVVLRVAFQDAVIYCSSTMTY